MGFFVVVEVQVELFSGHLDIRDWANVCIVDRPVIQVQSVAEAELPTDLVWFQAECPDVFVAARTVRGFSRLTIAMRAIFRP